MARPKKNNAEYFSHDADMRDDVKIKALRRQYSHIGYAVWNYILETLTDSEGFEVEWSELSIELLAADYDVTTEELSQIVMYCIKIELLQLNDNILYSEAHKLRFAGLQEARLKKSEAGKKGMAKRWHRDYTATESDNSDITPLQDDVTDSTTDEKGGKPKKPTVKRFIPPTLQEVEAFIAENNYSIRAESFVNHYESNGWMVGRNKMKDWKATIRGWHSRENPKPTATQANAPKLGVGERIDYGRRTYGDGTATIPMEAPARPSERYYWDVVAQQWLQ